MTPEEVCRHSPQVLTSSQRDFYFANGYLLLEGVLPPAQLSELRAGLASLQARADGDAECPPDFEFESSTQHGRRLRQVLCAADYEERIWGYVRSPTLIQVATDLLGPDVMLRETVASFKEPGGRGFDWHQDIVFFPCSNRSPLMTLTFIEDVTLDMGPTKVIPGTHLENVYDHYDSEGKWLGVIGEHEKPRLDTPRSRSITGPAGSILITNCVIVHAAEPNESSLSRPMVIVGYNSCDTVTYVEIPYKSRYRWQVVAGEASQYVHCENMRIRMPPDWRTHKGVRIDNLVQQ